MSFSPVLRGKVIFWRVPCEVSCRYWNPHQVEEVNYRKTRLAVTSAATVLRTGLKKMGTNWPWNCRLTILKAMRLVRPWMTSLNDCQSWLWCFCMSHPPSLHLLKLLSADCRRYRGNLPLPLAASIQNKANFPFHQSSLFIGFWAVSSQTLLSVTLIWIQRLINCIQK